MTDTWERIDAWLDAHATAVKAQLHGPASEGDLAQLAERTGLPRGHALMASLAVHDGEGEGGLLGASRERATTFMHLLSAKECLQAWALLEDALRGLVDDETSWSPSWIPFANDWGGGYLFVDSGSDELLVWDQETPERKVFADTYESWLEDVASRLDGFHEEDGRLEANSMTSMPPAAPPRSLGTTLLAILVERNLVELATRRPEALVRDIDKILETVKGTKKRTQRIVSLLESHAEVDELFGDDESIELIVDEFS